MLLFEAVVVSLMTATQVILNKTKIADTNFTQMYDCTNIEFTFIGVIHKEVLE